MEPRDSAKMHMNTRGRVCRAIASGGPSGPERSRRRSGSNSAASCRRSPTCRRARARVDQVHRMAGCAAEMEAAAGAAGADHEALRRDPLSAETALRDAVFQLARRIMRRGIEGLIAFGETVVSGDRQISPVAAAGHCAPSETASWQNRYWARRRPFRPESTPWHEQGSAPIQLAMHAACPA